MIVLSLLSADWRVNETMGQFAAYNTNAYLLRSSVSLGEKSMVDGCSMIVVLEG